MCEGTGKMQLRKNVDNLVLISIGFDLLSVARAIYNIVWHEKTRANAHELFAQQK